MQINFASDYNEKFNLEIYVCICKLQFIFYWFSVWFESNEFTKKRNLC